MKQNLEQEDTIKEKLRNSEPTCQCHMSMEPFNVAGLCPDNENKNQKQEECFLPGLTESTG